MPFAISSLLKTDILVAALSVPLILLATLAFTTRRYGLRTTATKPRSSPQSQPHPKRPSPAPVLPETQDSSATPAVKQIPSSTVIPWRASFSLGIASRPLGSLSDSVAARKGSASTRRSESGCSEMDAPYNGPYTGDAVLAGIGEQFVPVVGAAGGE
ncbi:hypothetical protein VTK56DRAFT_8076 [Thermocarpiscus australiensis]